MSTMGGGLRSGPAWLQNLSFGAISRPRVPARCSPTRYAVRSMWLALSSDRLSPAFRRELSLHHLGPEERQMLGGHHPPFHLETSLARSRWVRCYLTICFRLV